MKRLYPVISLLLRIIIFMLIFTGCVNGEKKDKMVSDNTKSEDTTMSYGTKSDNIAESKDTMLVDYDSIIRPIIESRCNNCHTGASDAYASLSGNSKGNKLKNIIVTDKMPKDGPLSADDKKIVLKWLDSLSGR